MYEKKTFAVAEVKAAESENPNGEFEVILSAETVDRDGEIVDAKAFDPLPDSIPFHAFHDFHDPIGRGVPFYDGKTLKARGTFASTPRAQEIRTLVAEGVIGHTSIGFMAAVRKDADEAPHVTKGELLEGSFVSVPSNREAAVLVAKEFEAAAKDFTSKATKADRVQAIHDLASQSGAACPAADAGKSARSAITRKGHGMTANDLREALSNAVREAHGAEKTYTWVRDYTDEWVVFEVESQDSAACWQQTYTVTGGAIILSETAVEVTARTTYVPTTSAPVTPAKEAGKSPASHVVEMARLRARASLL